MSGKVIGAIRDLQDEIENAQNAISDAESALSRLEDALDGSRNIDGLLYLLGDETFER